MVGAKVVYKFLIYNARTNDVGIPVYINGRMFVETIYPNCYRPCVRGHWEQIGFL